MRGSVNPLQTVRAFLPLSSIERPATEGGGEQGEDPDDGSRADGQPDQVGVTKRGRAALVVSPPVMRGGSGMRSGEEAQPRSRSLGRRTRSTMIRANADATIKTAEPIPMKRA